MNEQLNIYLNEYVPRIEAYLKGMSFADQVGVRLAAPLNEAMHYSVDAGGKRLRPVMTIMAYRLLADDWHRALPVARSKVYFPPSGQVVRRASRPQSPCRRRC